MRLRFDPFRVFRHSKTPVGLYARQKWLGESGSLRWQSDFQEVTNAILTGQLADGSWQHAPIATIAHLFGLHLTLRAPDRRTENALDWLMEKISLQAEGICVNMSFDISDASLENLPFISSRKDMFLTGATLFLASIFDRHNHPAVTALYRWLCKQGLKKNGLWLDKAASHNIFRAMVVHPIFSKDTATALAVECLVELQTDNGDWGDDRSFYQTLNALAHLDEPQADRQLENAFMRLRKTQNSDGTWSRHEPEWNTFLAIHALKNKRLF